ncbi:FMN-dependent NADH-azoreductase [Thermoflavimicrobium daqui]|uniref:FMN dependent NADH:quinone oxidoreductase n=1 Tax=Thermoflavimicrobium daqui TaxID=2137476 RepID=A0A364K2C9_9BACL|nr:FMN-dependent NADH-azoreductase [Thermoflavimicrobium daqui]RAL22580.1 FMN-dependent NADH-azoreductase [Thermoflavimicrobium daqui]
MNKVLFVKANSRPAEQAVSVQMYNAFLEAYKAAHPEDQVVELDLFAENLPYYSIDMINGMYKLAQGFELTSEEQKATATVNQYLDQFLGADKVVFAFPLWNFTVPAVLHTYLDYLSQAGKTFKYTQEGPVGLVTDKKVMLLCARGGIYSEGPMAAKEMALNYVSTIMGFFGVTDLHTEVIEGHNAFPDRSQSIIEDGLANVRKAAEKF